MEEYRLFNTNVLAFSQVKKKIWQFEILAWESMEFYDGLSQWENLNIWNISKMADHTVKWINIWVSGT